MDDDALMFLILLSPIVIGLSLIPLIPFSLAYSRTKKWQKARDQKFSEASSSLLSNDPATESDFADSSDEEDYHKRKAEEDADSLLTFNQKWRKEFRKSFSGDSVKDAQKKKEREDRKKLAKAVARQLDRLQRKREREALAKAGETELPSYRRAVGKGSKE